jgi:hypothetical protein
VYALGWLSLLVATGSVHAASEVASHSRTLAYLSIGFQVLGVLLLVTGLSPDFF